MSHSANAAKSFLRQTQSTLRKFEAWHTWILICAAGAGATFCFNLALTIWASTFGLRNGTATIKVGKCSDIKTWDLWFHLGINVLSSTLLAASNYTMQCLSAPVREEIDTGHRERIAFDIGIPSLKNLRRLSSRKLILWGLLAVSSIPLHLVYNSVVFSTISTHSYEVLVVTSDFLSGAPFGNRTQLDIDLSPNSNTTHFGYGWTPDVVEIENIRRDISDFRQGQGKSEWQKLDSKKCREAYRPELLSDRSDFLAVSPVNSTVTSLLYYQSRYYTHANNSWTCPHVSDLTCGNSNCLDSMCGNSTEDYFQLFSFPIDHCLSRRQTEKCQLQFSLPIMIIVIICNLTKAVCMLFTIRHRLATPLLTLGDAVASFLKRPDIYTKNNCLSDKYNFRQRPKFEKRVDQLGLCKPSLWRSFQHSGAKKSYISTDDSLNGEELQDLVAGNLPLKNHNLLEHQDWRENIRGFLTSITFNGQPVQGLICGELPLKNGSTSQHDNNASEHEGWSQNIKEWIPKRHFWFSAASPSRWLFSLSL